MNSESVVAKLSLSKLHQLFCLPYTQAESDKKVCTAYLRDMLCDEGMTKHAVWFIYNPWLQLRELASMECKSEIIVAVKGQVKGQ